MFENTPQPAQPSMMPGAMPQDTGSIPGNTGQVYTMPEKFMPSGAGAAGGGAPKKAAGWKKWLLIIGLILAAGVIILAVVVYVITTAGQPEGEVPQANANANENLNAANGNANANDNANENANANENTNGGISLNLEPTNELEQNINSGLFPNSNTNTDNSNVEPTTFPDRSDVRTGRDKDKDGLTDEEETLYDARFDLPDSDRDGFIDGNEVASGFSPTQKDTNLLQAGQAIEFSNANFGWTIQYPAKWFAEPLDETRREVLFTSDAVEGELVEVIVSDNPQRQTAAEWYASLYTDIEPEDLETVEIAGLEGIVSPDGYTYYIADDFFIIGIIYNFGTKEEIQFETSFEMMVNSFTYTARQAEATETNENSNTNTNAANTNTNTNTNSNSNLNDEGTEA